MLAASRAVNGGVHHKKGFKDGASWPARHSGTTGTAARQALDLEYDHVDPVANQGPTTYDNVKARCWKNHQIKTERDRKAGLVAPRPPNCS